MSLISLLVAIVIVGFVVWLITLIPMPEPFHKVIIGVVVLFLVLFVLQSLGVLTGMNLRLR